MKRACLIFVLLSLFVGTAFRSDTPVLYQFDHENVIGTSLQLKIIASSEQIAEDAEQIALQEIDRLANILSTYDSNSEVSLWMKTKDSDVKVSSELFDVLQLFDWWKTRTSGTLTAAIGPASQLWRNAESLRRLPATDELDAAIAKINIKQWSLNVAARTASHLSDQPLVLNSFVKSYVIRKVSDKVMALPGVTGVVTNIGGDIVVLGDHRELVRIADPLADAENELSVSMIHLENEAIATSGNYRRGFDINGIWFSHIIDPRTAVPAGHILSATVIANDATVAGALATAFNILSPEESAELASTIPGVRYQIITAAGDIIQSGTWKEVEVPLYSNDIEATTPSNQQKLEIEFELARFEGRFRRPFVAVWIENKQKESVRTLAVWYNKPRWLPDLKRWYSKNQSLIDDVTTRSSISSATRSPGSYTLTWNGLDDQGKTLAPGTYTVYIEAAREHGTYQLLKQEIRWNGNPGHYTLKGGVEITSAMMILTK